MRRHRITGLLGALALAVGALAAAGPASAATVSAATTAATSTAAPGDGRPGQDPPAEFGTDWHDPLTAAPSVARPGTRSCQVTLAEAQFRDFTPYRGSYAPPTGCGRGDWAEVVLRLDGKVKGRQYDRLGNLSVGGVEILSTSTPNPRPRASPGPSRRTSPTTGTPSAARSPWRC